MSLTITETAAEEVRKAIQTMKYEEEMNLRVTVSLGGCGGNYQYGLNFVPVTDLKDDDVVLELSGLKVVLDSKSAVLLDETTIDFQDNEKGRGFSFNNPTPKSGCGSCSCGK